MIDRLGELPDLGVGLGYRPSFRADLFRHRAGVDFLEIVADHYLDAPAEKLKELELLADHFAIVPHAIDLSLGSADGLDEAYVEALAALVERLHPPWWSEHVAVTRSGGIDIGHLSPLPFTREAVDVVCRNVEAVKRRIDVPLILENITYPMALPGSELSEAEFLSEILERTGCGLLLDVTNVYVNAANHGYDAVELLDGLPMERVVQLHFVGIEERDGFLIDSHAQPTPEEIWPLIEEAVARSPVRGIILERDENLPPFEELVAELGRARSILSGRRR